MKTLKKTLHTKCNLVYITRLLIEKSTFLLLYNKAITGV